MRVTYSDHYNQDYWQGRKQYKDANGQKQLYHGPSLAWEGFEEISAALAAILPKGTLLDVGCGGGDLARRLKARGFDSYGIDISDYAIENALVDMRDRLHICDATTEPELPPHFPEKFDNVIATDFLEHVYHEDLDRTFQWILDHTSRFLFFCIATVAFDKQEFVLKKGEPVPAGYEGTAVSGHVNVRSFKWWVNYFKTKWGLAMDWRRMYLLQMRRESVEGWRATMGWNMSTTMILEVPKC